MDMLYGKKDVVLKRSYEDTWGQLTHYTVRYGSDEVTREVYDSNGDGAAALLYNVDRDTVVLVRQWRITAQLKGVDDGWILEVPAGLLDDDQPDVAMIRELEEETGYRAVDLSHVATVFASPGAHLEQVHLYYGRVTDAMKVGPGGGLASEHEEIEVVEIPADSISQMLADGKVTDAKTLILLQHFMLLQGLD